VKDENCLQHSIFRAQFTLSTASLAWVSWAWVGWAEALSSSWENHLVMNGIGRFRCVMDTQPSTKDWNSKGPLKGKSFGLCLRCASRSGRPDPQKGLRGRLWRQPKPVPPALRRHPRSASFVKKCDDTRGRRSHHRARLGQDEEKREMRVRRLLLLLLLLLLRVEARQVSKLRRLQFSSARR